MLNFQFDWWAWNNIGKSQLSEELLCYLDLAAGLTEPSQSVAALVFDP